MSLLEVDGLEAGYEDAVVLRGVSLRADAHEIVADDRARTAPASRRC